MSDATQKVQGKRSPSQADFTSANCTVSIAHPAQGGRANNILILLHGFGDTQEPFAKLGSQLNLPHTICISIRGPSAVPFHEHGYHWGDDLIFDSSTSALDPDGGFKATTELLDDKVIKDVLINSCRFTSRDIILFGLGQGGMAALNVAAGRDEELGGVVSIGGPLPSSAPASSDPLKPTPILACYGSDSHWLNEAAQEKIKRNFKHVQLSKYKRKGDGMPQSREEMLPIMEFFSRRLRQAAPNGTIEMI